jgi:FAD binding domain
LAQRGATQTTTPTEEVMTIVESRVENPTQQLTFAELDAVTTGTVAVPGDEVYDALVSPWNVAIPVRPRAVLAARTAQDVVEAVRFASRNGLRVTPQATGHGPMADLTDELLVNTAGLDECVVHPEGWARVGAGVKWLRVVEAAAPYGLAPLSGSITDVGVVGYTTGGGLGPMARTYGLAIDRVRAIEVVTGDGVLRRATPTEHPDLFFALRGGKGMVGIVTTIEFDLVHQPTFYGGSLWFDGDDAATVIEQWLHWSDDLPELATTSIALFQLPPMPGVPEQLAGRLTLSVRYVWTGDAEEGERRFAAIRQSAPVVLDDVSLKPYTAIDSVHTDPLDPTPAYESASVLTDFPQEAVDALLALTGPESDSPQILVEVRQMGGATARDGEHESAFCARDTAYSLLTVGIAGTPGLEEHSAAVLGALAPWTGGRRLPNFTFEPADYRDAYDEPTQARLRRVVRAYDPRGVMAIGRVLFS